MNEEQEIRDSLATLSGRIRGALHAAKVNGATEAHRTIVARAGEQHGLALARQKEAAEALLKARAAVEQGDGTADDALITTLRQAREACVMAQGVVAGTWAVLQAVKKAIDVQRVDP